MEKTKALTTTITACLQNLDLNSSSKPNSSSNTTASLHHPVCHEKIRKHPSLVNLCVSVIGKHLEDLIPELGEIAINFPAHIKMAIAAIARRRKLLSDDVIISLVDSTWETLDISCSDVSNFGLAKVAEICTNLRTVDISQCSRITPKGLSQLVQHCRSLETLRCGGCPQSNYTAKRCLGLFKPTLNNVEGDSWEELDIAEITHGGQSLRWLVWPGIDPDLLETFSSECPRVNVNPQSSPYDFKGVSVPREALSGTVLDDQIVEDIDPSTWASSRRIRRTIPPDSSLSELESSKCEKFRQAYEERDTKLAPKRAKNARQHQRRAQREWMEMNPEIYLPSQATKSLRGRSRK